MFNVGLTTREADTDLGCIRGIKYVHICINTAVHKLRDSLILQLLFCGERSLFPF